MKALTLVESGKLDIVEVKIPAPSNSQVLVKLKAMALNKRDQFISEGKYPGIQFNCVLGSDGSGTVIDIGEQAGKSWLDKQVIVNPNINWGENQYVQSTDYSILGMPSDGTFAEYLLIDQDRLIEKPSHLTFEEAAAFPLGGITAFRACFHHGKIKEGDDVLISGFGGGVAQFAFQFAKATGAKVYVTSGEEKKRQRALDLGASDAFDYKQTDWHKKAIKNHEGFSVVIDSAGGDQINDFVKMMKPAGRIVFYGATNGLPSKLDLYRMFWNQVTLQGSTMGSDKEFEEMISFIGEHKIKPIIDSVRPFDQIISAFDDMKDNKKTGKIVVKL